MDETGWANVPIGTVIEFTFQFPIVNQPGPDLVLFDAQFDPGAYNVSSEFDAFATQFSADPFVYSGVDHNYFFSLSLIAGTFSASVFGAEIDLSDLGVPNGEQVRVIRAATTNVSADPLGMVAIIPEPSIGCLTLLGFGLGWRRRRR